MEGDGRADMPWQAVEYRADRGVVSLCCFDDEVLFAVQLEGGVFEA